MSILKIKDSQGNWVGVPTVKGDTGNGISSAVLNNDYTLTLTFTDGTTYTTPSIRGEKGEQGEPATDMDVHICSASEYDAETRIPTIANPNDKTFYLVPTEDGTSPDLFTEWVYVNDAWEMFGSMKIDLSGYLTDVQINGTSIVTDGVANVPFGSPYAFGVFKTSVNDGTYASDGILKIQPCNNSDCKKGTVTKNPVCPSLQHASAFYGLAKAAGDTSQSASSNAVGTYTDEAKGKIHDMLGIGVAKELRAYSELGEDMDLIEIPLPDRYEKVWFRFMCRINNAENNLPNGQAYILAWLGDSTKFTAGKDLSIYEAAYIRQLDIFMLKGWFVVDFPFVERFSTGSYGATNWSQAQTVRSQDGSYSYEGTIYDKLTSYPRSLFIRPYDTSNGYLFKANSRLGVYVK